MERTEVLFVVSFLWLMCLGNAICGKSESLPPESAIRKAQCLVQCLQEIGNQTCGSRNNCNGSNFPLQHLCQEYNVDHMWNAKATPGYFLENRIGNLTWRVCDEQIGSVCGRNHTCNCSPPRNQTESNGSLSLDNPKVFCAEHNLVSLTWSSNIGVDVVYFLQMRHENSSWQTHESFTTCNNIILKNLVESKQFRVRLWAVTAEGTIVGPSNTTTFKTPVRNPEPLAVPEIHLERWILKEAHYNALIRWTPPEDQSCYYDIVVFASTLFTGLEQMRITKVPESFEAQISELQFSENYTVQIMSLNKLNPKGKETYDDYKESTKTYLHLSIPSCLEAYQGNLTICVPEMPENLFAVESLRPGIFNDTPKYDLNVSWSLPSFIPDYYTLNVLTGTGKWIASVNITGNSTQIYLTSLALEGTYEVTLKGFSEAGKGEAAVFEKVVSPVSLINLRSKSENFENWIIVVVPIAIIVILIGSFLLVRKGKLKSYLVKKNNTYMENLKIKSARNLDQENYKLEFDPKEMDEWELEPQNLVTENVLGEGAFGVVRKGVLAKDKNCTINVAVKMLRDSPSSDEIRQFQQEIDIMKTVGSHRNIVSLVGCVTRTMGSPLLIVEYCSRGDLLSFLRNEWRKLHNMKIPDYANDGVNDWEDSGKHVFNQLYDMEAQGSKACIQPKDLLSFAHQIAMGMEYLSSVKVLHRDLAARNVLLCENFTVKVSDFGLSRDVYLNSVYCKSGGGKLPVKWMALESLMHQQYTAQSDVWSFGVLVWELVTLGQHPYPGVNTHDLLKLLVDGYRMERPANCGAELYALMTNCWQDNPKNRPSFTILRQRLEVFLEDVCAYLFISR